MAPDPAADDAGEDEEVLRFSMGTQPVGTPAAATPATAIAASKSVGGVPSSPADRAFDHDKNAIFLQKLSAAELRSVMRVLHIQGRM